MHPHDRDPFPAFATDDQLFEGSNDSTPESELDNEDLGDDFDDEDEDDFDPDEDDSDYPDDDDDED